MKTLCTPVSKEDIAQLKVGDTVYLSGKIFCGRDAVLPKVVALAEAGTTAEKGIELEGSLVFHTAVSDAGVGPTSSNKVEIEGSIAPLSKYGVRIHLGKGKIKPETIAALNEEGSCYAVIPPVTALLEDKTTSKRLVAFPELGMEAFYELEVDAYPLIIAAVNGKSIYDK